MKFLEKIMSGLWGWKIPNAVREEVTAQYRSHAYATVLYCTLICYEMNRLFPIWFSLIAWYIVTSITLRNFTDVQMVGLKIFGMVALCFGQPSGFIPFGFMIVFADKDSELAAPPFFWTAVKIVSIPYVKLKDNLRICKGYGIAELEDHLLDVVLSGVKHCKGCLGAGFDACVIPFSMVILAILIKPSVLFVVGLVLVGSRSEIERWEERLRGDLNVGSFVEMEGAVLSGSYAGGSLRPDRGSFTVRDDSGFEEEYHDLVMDHDTGEVLGDEAEEDSLMEGVMAMSDDDFVLVRALSCFYSEGKKSVIVVKGMKGVTDGNRMATRIKALASGWEDGPRVLILTDTTYKQAMVSIRLGDYDIVITDGCRRCNLNTVADDTYYLEKDDAGLFSEVAGPNATELAGCRGKMGVYVACRRRVLNRKKKRRSEDYFEPYKILKESAKIGKNLLMAWAVVSIAGWATKVLEVGSSQTTTDVSHGIEHSC